MSALYSQQLPSERENEEKKWLCGGVFLSAFHRYKAG